jgi:3-deoxy-D-manno-octulosonic acid kinase
MVSFGTLFFAYKLMPENITKVNHHCWIIANDNLHSQIDSDWFDDSYWLNQGRLLGASSGRGSAWMVKSDDEKMMLRHYYRGGIPAKFIKDKYLWTGLANTRSFSEYKLLKKMTALNLPVPEPIAAQVCKKGIFYQANILIKYILHDATFAALLNTDAEVQIWKNIGSTIANFHKQGINHADLNANNILIQKDTVYLIDFDHSKQCKTRKMWQQANIKRLKRSIDKLTDDNHIEVNQKKWLSLLDAYNQSMHE